MDNAESEESKLSLALSFHLSQSLPFSLCLHLSLSLSLSVSVSLSVSHTLCLSVSVSQSFICSRSLTLCLSVSLSLHLSVSVSPSTGFPHRTPDTETEEEETEKEEEMNEEEMEAEERALEFWLSAETQPSPNPVWTPLNALLSRERGSNPLSFTTGACGARSFVQRFQRLFTLDSHRGCVNSLHYNQSGTCLASGSDDLHVIVWDWASQRERLRFHTGHKSNVFQAKFLPNTGDTTMVMCARDGQVRVAELSATETCKSTRRVAQHRGSAHKLALHRDSPSVFLSAGEDAVIYSIDLRQDRCATKIITTKEQDKKIGLYSIYINPCEPQQFAVGGKDQYARIYDCRMIQPSQMNGSHSLFYTYLLTSYNDDDIYLFNTSDENGSEYIKRYKGHRNNATVKGVNFYGPRSQFIVSGSDCGHIFLWEKESCQIIQFLEGDDGGVVNCLEPHPHLPVLATSGLDHSVKIWAPTSQLPSPLCGLREVIKKNKRERDSDSLRQSDLFDSHMLWFLMHHLRERPTLWFVSNMSFHCQCFYARVPPC
uniref:DDB1 and CUL4 associated factor 8 n=1 Tax=Callorhinchus milii TaxID=7868 RepID=A0A4W3K9H9_CALMI